MPITDPYLQALAAAGNIAENLTVVAILVFIIILFIRGDVITKKAMDRILDEANNRTQLVVTALTESIEKAVRDGILEARAEWTAQLLSIQHRVDDIPCVRAENRK